MQEGTLICHIVELDVKPGRVAEFCAALRDNLSIWRAAPGFVDEIVLADPEGNRVIAQSYWRSEEDGANFERQAREQLTNLLREYLAGPPKATTYRLAVSTNRNLVPETGSTGEADKGERPPPVSGSQKLAIDALRIPSDMFVAGMELMLRVSRGARDLLHGSLSSAMDAAPAGPAPASSSGTPAKETDLVKDTLNGLIAFVVPGPDPYSAAQGMRTDEPGGIDAGILDLLIGVLNLSPSAPGEPPGSAKVAGLLNQIAGQINPSAAGSLISPFARLSFVEKTRVFQAIEANPQTLTLATLLAAIAFLVYSEGSAFDAATRTIQGVPVGWRISSYDGTADGYNEFKGYYQNRQSVATSPMYRT
jgi:heme-degrading monooxygenase HmoA